MSHCENAEQVVSQKPGFWTALLIHDGKLQPDLPETYIYPFFKFIPNFLEVGNFFES